jgi:hypothetical protein
VSEHDPAAFLISCFLLRLSHLSTSNLKIRPITCVSFEINLNHRGKKNHDRKGSLTIVLDNYCRSNKKVVKCCVPRRLSHSISKEKVVEQNAPSLTLISLQNKISTAVEPMIENPQKPPLMKMSSGAVGEICPSMSGSIVPGPACGCILSCA